MHLVGFIIRNWTPCKVTWTQKSLYSVCNDEDKRQNSFVILTLPALAHGCNEITSFYLGISNTDHKEGPHPPAAGKQTSSSEVSGDISQPCRTGTGRQITIWRVHWNTGYAHVIWMVEAPGLQTICLGTMPNGLHTHLRFQRLFPPVFKMRLALLWLQWDPPTVLLWRKWNRVRSEDLAC